MLKEKFGKIRDRHQRIAKTERDNIAMALAAHMIEGIVWPVCDFVRGLNRATVPSTGQTVAQKLRRWSRGKIEEVFRGRK